MPRFALFKTSFTGAKTGRTTDCITIHWTRGETAALLSRRVLQSNFLGGSFARVTSIVGCFFELAMKRFSIIRILILILMFGCSKSGLIEQAIGEKIEDCKLDVPCIVKIKDLTSFQWDEMHVFSYGSDIGEIEKTLRTKFPNYVEFKRRIIFLKDGKIVHWENEPTDIEAMTEGQVTFIGMENLPSQLSFTPDNAVFIGVKYYPTSTGVAYSLKQIK